MPKCSVNDRTALLIFRDILFELTDEEHPMNREQINAEVKKRIIGCEIKYDKFRANIEALRGSGLDIVGDTW